jgi:asparagine synthase (glutamine-hydrolysing)
VEKYLLKEAVRDPAAAGDPRAAEKRDARAGAGLVSRPLLPLRASACSTDSPVGPFPPRWLEQLLDGRLPGIRQRRGVKIWLLVTLEAWLRGVLKPGPVPR